MKIIKLNYLLLFCLLLSSYKNQAINSEISKSEACFTVETPFYIINIASVLTEAEAKTKLKELKDKNYPANYLWIPDYASLSGGKFYAVYIGPFQTQKECEIAVEKYKAIYPEAYGLLVSQENKRVQINGIDKVFIKIQSKADENQAQNPKFVFVEKPDEDYPTTKISVLQGGKETFVKKITGSASIIEKSEYADKGIPKNAIEACGAWYAGMGSYYYIIKLKNETYIYEGWQAEEQTESGYHWKKYKKLSSK